MLYFLIYLMSLGVLHFVNLVYCLTCGKKFNKARIGYLTIGLIAFYFFMAKGY